MRTYTHFVLPLSRLYPHEHSGSRARPPLSLNPWKTPTCDEHCHHGPDDRIPNANTYGKGRNPILKQNLIDESEYHMPTLLETSLDIDSP